ncbi:MAG: DUF2254 family protein [Chloroflexota bacterium]|nr:DUF2254 family protein [Chloroflexota bacterium]
MHTPIALRSARVSRAGRNAVNWLGEHVEHVSLAAIMAVHLPLLLLVLTTDRGLYSHAYSPEPLLSTIAQGAAAILALLVTLTLVATQLASAHYTPRMVAQRLKDAWFWGAVAVYLACILWALVLESARGWGPLFWELDAVSIALLLAGAALLYLVPFTIATLKSLQPEGVASMLIRRRDHDALDELLRAAVNDGKPTVVRPALALYTAHVEKRLARSHGAAEEAQRLADLFRNVGRHTCQRKSPDTFQLVLERLATLTEFCDEHPRMWRSAADVFNEAMAELYAYYKESSTEKDERVTVDLARASLAAGASFLRVAEVRAEGRERNLHRAVESFQTALSFYTLEAFPRQHAETQNSLGIAYRNMADVREKEQNLQKAIAAYQEALKVYTLQAFPMDYAMTQNNLGAAYGNLADVREKERNLQKAIAAYLEALVVRTLQAFPVQYAMTQNNLGTAYGDLADVRDVEQNLQNAIAAYQEALKTYTLQAFPVQYATTQNNLGAAYRNMADVREKEQNNQKAIAAYQEALVVYTFQAFPTDYAMTQNNLGVAYGDLANVRDKEQNLQKATTAFQEALNAFRAERLPVQTAGGALALAIAKRRAVPSAAPERARAMLVEAEALLVECTQAFAALKDAERLRQSQDLLAAVRAALQQKGPEGT